MKIFALCKSAYTCCTEADKRSLSPSEFDNVDENTQVVEKQNFAFICRFVLLSSGIKLQKSAMHTVLQETLIDEIFSYVTKLCTNGLPVFVLHTMYQSGIYCLLICAHVGAN